MKDHAVKAVFFDRDGVLNRDDGYVHDKEHFHWIEGAREAIARLSQEGWLLFVVTNQSGIARGYYTEEDVQQLHREINEELATYGGHITEFFYCPHLPGAKVKKYDQLCHCRKPEPGMILKALEKYHIPKDRAILFGDGQRDVEAAQRAGIRGVLYTGGNLDEFVRAHLINGRC